MAKGQNQKLKLLYLLKIFLEETDDFHGLTRQELNSTLNAHGVTAERKTLYACFEVLLKYGNDIISEKEATGGPSIIFEMDQKFANGTF